MVRILAMSMCILTMLFSMIIIPVRTSIVHLNSRLAQSGFSRINFRVIIQFLFPMPINLASKDSSSKSLDKIVEITIHIQLVLKHLKLNLKLFLSFE